MLLLLRRLAFAPLPQMLLAYAILFRTRFFAFANFFDHYSRGHFANYAALLL